VAFFCTPPSYERFIERISTARVFTVFPMRPPIGGLGAPAITAGPDSALWFAGSSNNTLARATTGELIERPLPDADSIPQSVVTGPDAALWFTEENANQIVRITTAGGINEFPIPILAHTLTTAGSIAQFTVPYPKTNPIAMVTGPDGALWFTGSDNNAIVQAVLSGPA